MKQETALKEKVIHELTRSKKIIVFLKRKLIASIKEVEAIKLRSF